MKFSEKVKKIRTLNNMTQAQFAESIGISRGNLANIEAGKVAPTKLLTNCISLMYNVSREWLEDDNNSDISELDKSTNMVALITEKFSHLSERSKKYVLRQINDFMEWENEKR